MSFYILWKEQQRSMDIQSQHYMIMKNMGIKVKI